ncbi:hypothetical protein KAR91_06760 [Candidatus Pacearchaeota archaeon]|nr:hypothetical protein [Candidatus Pacearchaeota archaeon]
MKTITLKQQHLQSWKAAHDQTIDFQNRTHIYWANEKGKTTIKEAFEWLVFGKHPKGKTDIDIKTKYNRLTKSHYPEQEINTVIHHLDHISKAIIDIDGNGIELKKTFHETWDKSLKKMKGHTTDHSFDKHKLAEGKYKAKIAEIIDEKTFQILTDPLYFPQTLPWKESRNILISMCPKVDQTTVEGYEKIKELIQSWSAEEKKVDVKSEIKKSKTAKEKIQPAINENHNHFIDVGPELRKIEDVNADKADIQEKINRVNSGSSGQEIKNQIAELNTQIIEAKNVFNAEKLKKEEIITASGKTGKEAIVSTQDQIDELKGENSGKQTIIDAGDNRKAELITGFKRISSLVVQKREENFVATDKCFNCEQPLPESMTEKSRQNFNLKKAEALQQFQKDLDIISSEGKELKEKREKFTVDIAENLKLIEPKKAELVKYNDSRDSKVAEITALRLTKPDVSLLEAKKTDLESKIKEPVDVSEYVDQIEVLDTEVKQVNQRALNVDENKKYTKRIGELEKEDDVLSERIAELETQLIQLDEFIVAEVKEHSKAINAMFEIANFKMFDIQVNGNIDNNVCEAMKDGIPFNCLNSAAQIQVGIDIIKTLQKYYGIKVPIFVDNRESVTEIPDIDCQVISLFVSPQDEEIRIEYAA